MSGLNDIMEVKKAILLNIEKTGKEASTITCPLCRGQVSYTRAYNGHVHAKCSSDDCVYWME